MAYPRKMRDFAFSNWFSGHSLETLIPMLAEAFPNESTPTTYHTLRKWKKAEDWEGRAEQIAEKVTEKVIEREKERIDKARAEQEATLERFHDHVRLHLNRVVRDKRNPQKVLDSAIKAGDLSALMTTFHKAVITGELRAGRPTEITEVVIPQLDLAKLTDDELTALRDGLLAGIPPQQILSAARLAEVTKKG